MQRDLDLVRDGWVKCPICDEDNMPRFREALDHGDERYIQCLNTGCASNQSQSSLPVQNARLALVEFIAHGLRTQAEGVGGFHYAESRGVGGMIDYVAIDGNPDLFKLADAILNRTWP